MTQEQSTLEPMCLFIRRNNSEAIVGRGKVHEQLMTNYDVYRLTPWAKLTFSRVKLTAYRAQLVGSPADCSMSRKHKHGEDQRSAVVHFILLNGRFPPSTLLLWGDLSKWKHSNWWIRVRVCSHMPSCSRAVLHFTLFLPLFVLLNCRHLLLVKGCCGIHFILITFSFPTCPVTNLGGGRWIT